MTSYPPLDAMNLSPDKIERVDCGTCPVTLACAIDKGGNGYRFSCCNATGFETADATGAPLLLIIDCTKHRFERHIADKVHDASLTCPLCSGEIVDNVLNKVTDACEWVPTIHAKVPVETRLDTWRRAFPAALARSHAIAERKKGP